MYRIPKDLDLSKVIGEFATQICVGQSDIQFSLGNVTFTIESQVKLIRDGRVIGSWKFGKWPTEKFYEVMNVCVVKYEVTNERTIILILENNIEIHMNDDTDQSECIEISINGDTKWII